MGSNRINHNQEILELLELIADSKVALRTSAAEVSALKAELAEVKGRALSSVHIHAITERLGVDHGASPKTPVEYLMENVLPKIEAALAQRDEVIQAMRDQAECADLIIAQRDEMVRALRARGGHLSNCAYNLSQSESLSSRERKSLKDCQAAWDEACSAALRELEGGE